MKPVGQALKAYTRGKSDFKAGVTQNPYVYLGSRYIGLCGWWEKGFHEAKAKNNSK